MSCLVYHQEINYFVLLEAIISKMSDPDDKVRIAVCKVFSQLEYECASKLVEKGLFVELAKRCRDRKVHFWKIFSLFKKNLPKKNLV